MKRMICEMCGGSDLIKDDGVFVCQSCGCKYSLDEAKKMMIEGTVEIKGSVNIDYSNEIQNMLIRAKQFYDDKEIEKSEYYYNKVLDIDAQNADALKGLDIIDKTIIEPNLTIIKSPIKQKFEIKTFIYMDGIRYGSSLIDQISIKLPIGEHELFFKNFAFQSEKINIPIKNRNDKYILGFDARISGIKTILTKKTTGGI